MSTGRKPGRPRKRVDVCPVGIHGIVPIPTFQEDCVELVYNQAQLLKCIISIFKEYDSDEIAIEFYADHVVFSGRDHSLHVTIRIVINASDMNLYYFAPPAAPSEEGAREPSYSVVVKRDNLEIIVPIIEKAHYKITIALHHGDLSSLFIVLSNCDYDSEDCLDINIVPRAISPDDANASEMLDLSTYPLEFTLDSHHLRRKMVELKKFSQDIIFKKEGNGNFEISFGTNGRVVYTGTYKTSSKIKLRSQIADGVLFVATMQIARLRPLMTVNLPGGITFYANHTDPLVIQVGLDQRPDGHFAIMARLLINTAH